MINEELTKTQKEKIQQIVGHCEICEREQESNFSKVLDFMDADLKLAFSKIRGKRFEDKDQAIDALKKVNEGLEELKDIDMPQINATKMKTHRVKRQGPYVLRNIMIICGSCHDSLHYNEPGHVNK